MTDVSPTTLSRTRLPQDRIHRPAHPPRQPRRLLRKRTARQNTRIDSVDFATLAQRYYQADAALADQILPNRQFRLTLIGSLFVAAFVIIGLRLVQFNIEDTGFTRVSPDITTFRPPQPPARAELTDRRDMLVALDVTSPSLYANPHLIIEPKKLAHRLARILAPLSEDRLHKRLSQTKRFVWVRRRISPQQKSAILDLGEPGLNFLESRHRVYTQGNLLSHALGYTDIDGTGIAGLERALDKRLRDRPGDALRLSLSLPVQHILRNALRAAAGKWKAAGAIGIIQDVRNGEIIAMVSLPDFDPRHPTASPDHARFNRVTQGVYELGSIFKILTVAMVLESGKAGLSDQFDARAPIKIDTHIITDPAPARRWLSVAEIFRRSSNIGAARIASYVGRDRQREYLRDFGLLAPPSIEIAETARPIVPRYWGPSEVMTIGFGHGLAVSPMAYINAVSSLVSDGRLKRPTLLAGRRSGTGATEPALGKRIVSEKTVRALRSLLRDNVVSGTGRAARLDRVLVGGKTGSAEKIRRGVYQKDKILASFVAVFPINEPRYTVLIVIDEPKGAKVSGGSVAAPIAASVIEKMAPIMAITPIDDGDAALARSLAVPTTPGGRRIAAP